MGFKSYLYNFIIFVEHVKYKGDPLFQSVLNYIS